MPHHRQSNSVRFAVTGLALALGLCIAPVFGEDGTSGSTPTPVNTCAVAPAAEVSAAATVVQATPAGTPESPLATPVVVNDPIKADITVAANSILTCMSENNVETLTKLTTPEFRGSWLGMGIPLNDEDFGAILPMMPRLPYGLVGVDQASADSTSATATVRYTEGKQLISASWEFSRVEIDGSPAWRVTAETYQTVQTPTDAAVITVTVADGSFKFAPASVPGGNIVLNVTNAGKLPHEVLILRLPSDMSVEDVLESTTGIPDGATFVAQSTVPAGTSGNVVLTDVRPGTYTVVDLLPDTNGMPNASSGMVGTFEVVEP